MPFLLSFVSFPLSPLGNNHRKAKSLLCVIKYERDSHCSRQTTSVFRINRSFLWQSIDLFLGLFSSFGRSLNWEVDDPVKFVHICNYFMSYKHFVIDMFCVTFPQNYCFLSFQYAALALANPDIYTYLILQCSFFCCHFFFVLPSLSTCYPLYIPSLFAALSPFSTEFIHALHYFQSILHPNVFIMPHSFAKTPLKISLASG